MRRTREQRSENAEVQQGTMSPVPPPDQHHSPRSCCNTIGRPSGLEQRSRLSMRSSRLAMLAIITPAFAYICLYAFGAARESAAGESMSKKATWAGNVPGVKLEGFYARRRALMDGVISRPTAAGEPVGFVFEEDSKDKEGGVSAAELLAAAGPPVIVLDEAEGVQSAIRRCIDEDGCSPSDITRSVRSQVWRLVPKALNSASASPSAAALASPSSIALALDANSWGHPDTFPGAALAKIGVDGREIDLPLSATGEEETAAPPGEFGSSTEERFVGSSNAQQQEEAVRGPSKRKPPAAAPTEHIKSVLEDTSRRKESKQGDEAELALSGSRAGDFTRGGDTGLERKGSIPSGTRERETNGRMMSASSSPASPASRTDAGKGEGRGIPAKREQLSERSGQQQQLQQQQELYRGSARDRGTIDDKAEPWAVVLAFYGWKRDEIEALIQAFPGTPWLYLVHHQDDGGGDGSYSSCQKNILSDTVMGLMSDPNHISNGLVLMATRLTAGAAVRVLRRHFGVKLRPVGELSMAQLYARKVTAEDGDISLVRKEEATTTLAGEEKVVVEVAAAAAATTAATAAVGCSSHEKRAHYRPTEAFREAAEESVKVLGGPFDTFWWWGSGDNNTHNRVVERGRQQEASEEGPAQDIKEDKTTESEEGLLHSGEGTPAFRACPAEDPMTACPIAASGRSGAGCLSPEDELVHGGACAGGGDGCGIAETQRSWRVEEKDCERGTLVSRTSSSPSSSLSATAAVLREADEGTRPHQPQSPEWSTNIEAASFGSGRRQTEASENEFEEQERWERGLRRMIDGDAPSWMSSEVYSEPVEGFPCPDVPGPEYPMEWPLLDLLANWNPGNASSGIPERHFLGVCRFDFQTELHKAQAYSLSEVPFIVYNIPDLDKAVQEWSNPVKLAAALSGPRYSVDVSSSNRFLYYGKRRKDRPPGWTPPTRRVMKTFDWWLEHALGVPGIDDHDEDRHESDGSSDGPYESDHRLPDDDRQALNDDINGGGWTCGLSSSDNDCSAASHGEDMPQQSLDNVPDHGSLYRSPSQYPDQCPDQNFEVSLEQSLDTSLEQALAQPVEQSLDQPSRRRGGVGRGRGEFTGSPVEQGDYKRKREETERMAEGSSNAHYYFKLSSTLEKPNLFVERSLPFFVPSPPSEGIDDGYLEDFAGQTFLGASPANEREDTTDIRGRRRKSPRKRRWASNRARHSYRSALSREGEVGTGGEEEAVRDRGAITSENHQEIWGSGEGLPSPDVNERYREGDEGEEEEAKEDGRERKRAGEDTIHSVDSLDDVNIFLRDASATKGIHCRLGMDGVMSDGHYDGSRNMVALLAGKRRWILSKPQNCGKMHMFRKGHPSARHTSADWTDPEVASQFPDLREATASEVILRAGEALYVPEQWIHSIVNIGVSAQCNSRSGKSFLYHPIIRECEGLARGE